MLCGKTRSYFPKVYDIAVNDPKRTTSSGETERRIPLGPGMVGHFPGIMECQMYDVRVCKKSFRRVRRFWIMGLQGIVFSWGVVPAGMAGILEELHITIKQLFPVVLSVALWGGHWHDSTIRCRVTMQQWWPF